MSEQPMPLLPPNGPRPWSAAPQLGTDRAYQAVGEVAAPLLAGFSVTLIGVVAQDPTALRWPGAALLALTVAAVLLLTCVQAAFFARQNFWTRDDLLQWYVEEPPEPLLGAFKAMQATAISRWLRWIGRARAAYNAGLTVLLVAVALVLAPPIDYGTKHVVGTEAALRWIAFGFALACAAAEIVWWAWPRLAGPLTKLVRLVTLVRRVKKEAK
jgi:hypothetical protein